MFIKSVFNTVIATVGELFSLTALACIYLINLEKRDPKKITTTDDQDKDIPIFLIHGYMHNSSAWIYVRPRLNEAGYQNVYTINLGFPTFKSIEEYSKQLDAKIQKILQNNGNKKIRLIGHSMGGLIACYYASQSPNAEVIDVITLGAPLLGTKMAFLGVGDSISEMDYQSNFSKHLISKVESSYTTRYFHFGSEADLMVRPTDSATFKKHYAPNVHIFSAMGHVAYLFAPKVSTMIIELFKRAA